MTYSISWEVVESGVPLALENLQDILLEELKVLGFGPKEVRTDGLMGLIFRWLNLAQIGLSACLNRAIFGSGDDSFIRRYRRAKSSNSSGTW